MKKILIFLVICLYTSNLFAQIPVYDSQKENQIKSMETGHWDFSPSWWYYFFHKNYSGAHLEWKWRGFKSRVGVEFDENRSNIKSVGKRREKQIATQLLKKEEVERERKLIKELNDEEIKRSAERNCNLVYSKYRKLFLQMQESITEGLTYCMTKSKGNLAKCVKELTDRNEIITSNINYLNKTGIGYELEQTKREKGLAQAKSDMEDLLKKVVSLSRVAKAYY